MSHADAISLARRGIPVFPCGQDKQPLTAAGFHDASTDTAVIRRWWTDHPDALVGVPTGLASGYVALDMLGFERQLVISHDNIGCWHFSPGDVPEPMRLLSALPQRPDPASGSPSI